MPVQLLQGGAQCLPATQHCQLCCLDQALFIEQQIPACIDQRQPLGKGLLLRLAQPQTADMQQGLAQLCTAEFIVGAALDDDSAAAQLAELGEHEGMVTVGHDLVEQPGVILLCCQPDQFRGIGKLFLPTQPALAQAVDKKDFGRLRVTLRLAGECRSILGANEELLARCIRPGRTATRTGNGLRTSERRCRHFGSQGSEADRAREECTSGGVHDGSSTLCSDPYSTPLTRLSSVV